MKKRSSTHRLLVPAVIEHALDGIYILVNNLLASYLLAHGSQPFLGLDRAMKYNTQQPVRSPRRHANGAC